MVNASWPMLLCGLGVRDPLHGSPENKESYLQQTMLSYISRGQRLVDLICFSVTPPPGFTDTQKSLLCMTNSENHLGGRNAAEDHDSVILYTHVAKIPKWMNLCRLKLGSYSCRCYCRLPNPNPKLCHNLYCPVWCTLDCCSVITKNVQRICIKSIFWDSCHFTFILD